MRPATEASGAGMADEDEYLPVGYERTDTMR